MTRTQNKRQQISKYNGYVCPKIREKLEGWKNELSFCRTIWVGDLKFQVSCINGDQFVVDLEARTCKCRRWDLTMIQCPHAIRAIYENNDARKPEDYVDRCYTKEMYQVAYRHIINPINGSNAWQ